MTRLRTPLLSFEARGSVSNAVAFANNRNRPQARAYATPHNPQTPAQQAHRATVAHAVELWPQLITTAEVHDGWNLHARTYRHHGTGYHAWLRNAIRIRKFGAQQAMVWGFGTWTGDTLSIGLFAPHYSGPPTFTDTFLVTYGSGPYNLNLSQQLIPPITFLELDMTGYPDTYVYYQVKYLDIYRSGINRKDKL